MKIVSRCVSVITALLVGSCGDNYQVLDANGVPPDARLPVDAAPLDASVGIVPRVEAAACRFVVAPSLGLTEGTGYECGDLVVNENRTTPHLHIRLHYIRFVSPAASRDATIYFSGGPGGSGQEVIDYAAFLGPPFLTGLVASGDFLVIGQRGTELSIPYLDCTSVDCSDFADRADLSSYNTAANADDVEDLRATLGYDRLNLYGISYGSRLGLEVLRRHGDHVRAAVIEGLVPAQVVWPAMVPSSFYSAMTALQASCASTSCGQTFGNLVTKLVTAVNTLRNNPVEISYQGELITLDGDSFSGLLFQLLYSRSTYPWLPLVISDLAIRRTDRITNFLGQVLLNRNNGGFSIGLYYAVVCGELLSPPMPNIYETANAHVPQEFRNIVGDSWAVMVNLCEEWPDSGIQLQLAQPVTSAVRTLVSSGRLDPITPPTFGDIAAATLSDSIVVVHENSGHGATLQSECGNQTLLAFLANPTAALDTSCAATIATNYVMPNAARATVLPIERIRAELRLAPPLPPMLRPRSTRAH